MTSISTTNNFLDNFNLDGTQSSKTVEKIKKGKSSEELRSKLIKKFLFIGCLSHLLHFLLLNPSETKSTEKKDPSIRIPKNYGQIQIEASMKFQPSKKIQKIKIMDLKYTKVLATGYFIKAENQEPKSYSNQNQIPINFYIPYSKFKDVLLATNKGIALAPFKMEIKNEEKYEIQF